MFRPDLTLDRKLLAYTPRDMVPDDSDVYLYIDLFDQLDLEEFYYAYSSQGQDSVDPKLMLRTIFYGLTHGIATGRKLENACRYDNRFMVLCGGHQPIHRTFSRFLKRHHSNMECLFIEIIRLAQSMGLVSLGRVAIDGTRIKGNTSSHRTLEAGKFDRAVEKIKEELKQLRVDLERANHAEASEIGSQTIPKEIRNREKRIEQIKKAKERLEKEAKERGESDINPKTQVSLNDPDARGLGSRREKFILGYNCQAVADEDHQIIVAAEITDNTNDSVGFSDAMDAVIANCGKVPEVIMADAGYLSIANLEKTTEMGAEPILSLRKEEEKKRLEDVRPVHDGKEGYECLAGVRLKGYKIKKKDVTSIRVDVPVDHCGTCSLKDKCSLFNSGKKKLNVLAHAERQVMLSHVQRTRTEEFAKAYKMRKAIIEPVFANIKTQKGLCLFKVGRENAAGWWKMVCSALNIEKMIRFIKKNNAPLNPFCPFRTAVVSDGILRPINCIFFAIF